jgi:glycosyltransferase involved in cell wall biosynthesis
LNILIVSSHFYPDGGGAEIYAYNIAKKLVERGNNVTILCSNQSKRNKIEHIDCIRVIRLKRDCAASTTPIKFNLFHYMFSFMRNEDFDLVNVNFHLPYYPDVATFSSKLCDLPTVLTYHNDIVKTGFCANLIAQIYNYSVNSLVLRTVNKIVTPSPYCFYESKFLKPFKDKLLWIPPGVDIKKYSVKESFKIHQVYRLEDSTKIVLFVGIMSRAHVHKGVDQLIKSFSKVLKVVKDVYLVLVGRGDMIQYYKKMCKDLGISNRVIFTGYVEEEALIEYYQSSYCVVLPSITVQEGFGMTLIEAGACGKPVIGTRVGGIKYVIRDRETGLLVPPKNLESLANAIISLLNDEDLARMLGTNGRKLVEKRYVWERTVDITEKVYKDVIGASAS